MRVKFLSIVIKTAPLKGKFAATFRHWWIYRNNSTWKSCAQATYNCMK